VVTVFMNNTTGLDYRPTCDYDYSYMTILYTTSGNRIHWNSIYNCRQRIRVNFLHCYWISWGSCNNWNHILNCYAIPNFKITLF